MIKKVSYIIAVVIISLVVGLSLQFAKAWTEPSSPPPGGNVNAPITTTASTQYKAGALGVGGVFHGYLGGYFDDSLTVKTDKDWPNATLQITSDVGHPNIQLKSNISGSNEWSIIGCAASGCNPANALRFFDKTNNKDRMVILNNGNVGIGTTGPGAKFQVLGGKVEIGSVTEDYKPFGTAPSWNYTLQLDAKDFSSIGFHDDGNSVGSIVYNDHNFYIGGDSGWGVSDIRFSGITYSKRGTIADGAITCSGGVSYPTAEPDVFICNSPVVRRITGDFTLEARPVKSDPQSPLAVCQALNGSDAKVWGSFSTSVDIFSFSYTNARWSGGKALPLSYVKCIL